MAILDAKMKEDRSINAKARAAIARYEKVVFDNIDDFSKYAHENVYDAIDLHSDKLRLETPPDGLKITGHYMEWHQTSIAHTECWYQGYVNFDCKPAEGPGVILYPGGDIVIRYYNAKGRWDGAFTHFHSNGDVEEG